MRAQAPIVVLRERVAATQPVSVVFDDTGASIAVEPDVLAAIGFRMDASDVQIR